MRPRSLTLVLLAIAGFLVALCPLLPHRLIDPDELEHSHATWLMFKGMVPYKDFFEHHTPWYYYVLRPLFNWFNVDGSFESATHFLVTARALSLVLGVLSIALVVRIGWRWADRTIGLLAGLLLLTQPVFFQKAIEIRPDMLALPFYLAALAFLVRALAPNADAAAPRLRWFVAAGLALGAAIMSTQKMLFVLPGVLAGLGLWTLSAGRSAGRAGLRARVLATASFLASVGVPAALTWLVFAAHGAAGAFVTNNFLLNARWKPVATHQLLKLITTSWPVLALSLVGVAASLARFFRSRERDHADVLLICVVATLFAGVAVLPSAHRQYYLMPLPIVCLFAAKGLRAIALRLGQRARPPFAVLATLGLAVLPIDSLRDAYQERNGVQLAQLRTVYQRTAPTDLVMDGWQGMGVFRPHAFHYYFLHEETRAMLPPEKLDAYLDALERGAIRPKLIVLDENLRALGPRLVGFVEAHYTTSDGLFYFARESG